MNNLTSSYEEAYDNMNELANILIDSANKNQTLIPNSTLNSLQHKLEEIVNNVLDYKINSSDLSYKHFNDVNKKLFTTTIYLTRIVSIINKIVTNIANLNVGDDLQSDLESIKTQFRTRPDECIAVHFDLITDVIWTNQEQYTLIEAIAKMCDVESTETNKRILMDRPDLRVKKIICSKRYKEIYSEAVKNYDDFKNARYSLMNVIQVLQNGTEDVPSDVFDFFNER